MKKWFDLNFYKDRIYSFKAIGIIVGIILMLEALLVPLFVLLDGDVGDPVGDAYFELLHPLSMAPLLVMVPITAFAMAYFSMRDFDSRNGSDFYHALPLTRSSYYITSFLAVLTWAVALFVIPFVTQSLLMNLMRYACVLEDLGETVVIMFILILYVVSAIYCARGLTGTKFSHFVLTAMILVLPRLFISVITAIIESNAQYLILSDSHNILFDNRYNLVVQLIEEGELSVPSCLYTLALSAVYFFVGLWLFNRRPSETAISPASSPKVQAMVRNLLALTVSLVPIALTVMMVLAKDVSGDDMTLTFFGVFVLYIIAVLVYFIYEVMSTKKFSNIKRAMKGLKGVLIGNILIYAFIAIVLVIASRVPKVDNVKRVEILALNVDYWDDTYYTLQLLEDSAVKDKAFHGVVIDALKEAVKEGSDWSYSYADDYYYPELSESYFDLKMTVAVKIYTKTGSIYRKINLTRNELALLKQDDAVCQLFYDKYLPENMKEDEAHDTYRQNMYLKADGNEVYLDLKPAERELLRMALDADRKNLTPAQWANVVLPDSSIMDEEGACILNMMLYQRRVSCTVYEFILSPKYTPNAVSCLKSLGYYDKVFGGGEEQSPLKYFIYDSKTKNMYFINDVEGIFAPVYLDQSSQMFYVDNYDKVCYVYYLDYPWYIQEDGELTIMDPEEIMKWISVPPTVSETEIIEDVSIAETVPQITEDSTLSQDISQ